MGDGVVAFATPFLDPELYLLTKWHIQTDSTIQISTSPLPRRLEFSEMAIPWLPFLHAHPACSLAPLKISKL